MAYMTHEPGQGFSAEYVPSSGDLAAAIQVRICSASGLWNRRTCVGARMYVGDVPSCRMWL
jgi:hypothetical protein